MKRRDVETQTIDRSPPESKADINQAGMVTVAAYSPMPECLERWTGNLLYWVTSMGAQFYTEVVAPFGVSPSHIAVLQILAYEGSLRQARLSDRTRIDKATMVSILNELERQELIVRVGSPSDKRAFDVSITATGKERLRQIEEVSQVAEADFYGVLSSEEQQTLRSLLKRLASRARTGESR